jgi:hypothetical protein
MPRKTKVAKKAAKKTVVKKIVRRKPVIAVTEPAMVVRRRRVLKAVPMPEPKVDKIVTETDIVTEPRVEVRRPATLAQALTERAEVVIKPETKVVSRVVKTKRGKKAA